MITTCNYAPSATLSPDVTAHARSTATITVNICSHHRYKNLRKHVRRIITSPTRIKKKLFNKRVDQNDIYRLRCHFNFNKLIRSLAIYEVMKQRPVLHIYEDIKVYNKL